MRWGGFFWAALFGLLLVPPVQLMGQDFSFAQPKPDPFIELLFPNSKWMNDHKLVFRDGMSSEKDLKKFEKETPKPQPKPKVRDLGGSRNVVIRGNKTFSEEEIKKGLFRDINVRLAAIPSRELPTYLERLRNSILAGYRQAGFPRVSARVELNPEKRELEIIVEEGPRFEAGEIRVLNAKTIPVPSFIAKVAAKERYTEKELDSIGNADSNAKGNGIGGNTNNEEDKTMPWEPGKPASFEGWPFVNDDRYADQLPLKPGGSVLKRVEEVLKDFGYYFPNVQLTVELDADRKTATLVVDILDEGPRAVIGGIEIIGNKINSREEVLEYLEIKPGMTFTREDWANLNLKLWNAARFIKTEITPIKPASAEDRLLLKIELVEYPNAPPLSKPFSQEEQIMLKMGAWLNDQQKWEGDLVLELEEGDELKFEYVASPQEGICCRIWGKYPDEYQRKKVCDYAIIHTPKMTGVYNVPLGRKYCLEDLAYTVTPEVRFKFAEKPDADRFGEYRFGIRYAPKEKAKVSRLTSFFGKTPPAFWVALLHEYDAVTTLQDDLFTVTNKRGGCWKIQASTGRLYSFNGDSSLAVPNEKEKSSDNEKSSKSTEAKSGNLSANRKEIAEKEVGGENESDEISKMRIRFAEKEVLRRTEKIFAETKDFPDDYEPQRPVGSLLNFALKEPWVKDYLRKDNISEKWLLISKRLLTFGAFDSIDQWIMEYCKEEKDAFFIPWEPGKLTQKWDISSLASWAMMVFVVNDELFPASSWPATIIQQASLVGINQHQAIQEEGDRIYSSPDSGPLCVLVIGKTLECWKFTGAKEFAQQGLKRLDKKLFLKDCEPFLSKDYQVGKSLRKMVEIYRTFSNEEVQLLAEGMDEQSLKYLKEADRILRSDPTRPFEEVMSELLGVLWDAGLKDQIERELKKIVAS